MIHHTLSAALKSLLAGTTCRKCSLQLGLPVLVMLGGGLPQAAAQQLSKDSLALWQQPEAPKAGAGVRKKIEITQSLQLWNVYTFEALGEQAGERRNDLYIRRGRLGVKGELRQDLDFNISFAYDGIGRDKHTAGNGSPNPDDNKEFFLWEAFWMWRQSPLFNITAGYFRPQVGREHMTAAFKTASFEKSLSNFQPRAHAFARGTGRELGLNVGGLYQGQGWSLNYNLGAFDISSEKLVGTGSRWFPLLASRLAISLGDPELDTYGIGYTHSYYGKRRGITFALNSTYQGETERFKSNSFYGGDILANWGPWDITAEWDWLYRSSLLLQEPADVYPLQPAPTTDQVFTFKLAYNLPLKGSRILQAGAMYSSQQAQAWGETQGLNALTGATDQQVYDLGLNYLLNKDNLKLSLHYIWGQREDRSPGHHYSYLGSGFQYLF
ncbi:phosphate porin [Cesiribacter andamanensis]|uniref:Phosphate-selective porin n=1 Tax=Cesiribacter andamanensis AMV16 TaxID=1279009 RepID=M7N5S4_9BACT|nr:phosphate porin [Cesiribacter andamanensis]EMR03983.1 Phosphate-selective porin [Cesiribacter andamanensis AMV16]